MYDEASHLLAGLIEQMPEEVHLDPEPVRAPETGSARTARERREAAERKRRERARRKRGGVPDPQLVDRAIATALHDISRRAAFRSRAKALGNFSGMAITLEAILGQSIQELVEHRGVGLPQARAAIKQRLGLTRQA
jgi:hypothetical protein